MKKKFRIALGIFVLFLVAALALWVWVSTGALTRGKQAVLEFLPLPMATVSGSPISTKQFMQRYKIAKAYYASQKTDQEIKKQIFDQLVAEEKNERLAAKLDAIPNQEEINQQFNSFVQNANQQNQAAFEVKLKALGLSQAEFKTEVLKPEAVLTSLLIWYNSQSSLNKNNYDLLNELKNQITQGASFESLAVKYNQDESSNLTQGDLGYLETADLLPEFQGPLQAAKLGDMLIVPSRYGIHLFKIEGKDNNGATGSRIHLREIFLKLDGFENWLAENTKNYEIKKFINLF